MHTIEGTIKEIAEKRYNAFSYVFENWADADTKLEKLSYPAIVCVMPVGGMMGVRNGKVKDTEYVGLAFLDKAPRGAEGEDNERIYNRMKEVAATFVEELNKTRRFEPITEIPYDIICEQLATVVSGILLQLTIKQQVGGCVDATAIPL